MDLLLKLIKGKGPGAQQGAVLVCDADLKDADRVSVLDLRGFGCQTVTHDGAAEEVITGVHGDSHISIGSHGGAAGGVRHCEVYPAVRYAQRIGVLRRYSLGDFGIALAELLYDHALPLNIWVMTVAVFRHLLIVHKAALLNQMIRSYAFSGKRSIFSAADL